MLKYTCVIPDPDPGSLEFSNVDIILYLSQHFLLYEILKQVQDDTIFIFKVYSQ